MNTSRATAVVLDSLLGLVKGCVWVLIAPKNNTARNYIILTPVTGNRLTDLDGYTGHNQQLLQVDVWANDYDTCAKQGEAVIRLLDQRPEISVEVQTDRDDHDPVTNLFRKSIDFLIWEQTS